MLYFLFGRFARRLVTVSHFSARELDDVLGIAADKFVVAGCAADTLTKVTPERPAIDALVEPFYLTVGTIAVHKNLPGPVRAVTDSGRSVVVGTSGNQQVFSGATALSNRAVIAGRLSDTELAWPYRHARALIFPSKYEVFGLPSRLSAAGDCCPPPEVAPRSALSWSFRTGGWFSLAGG